MIGKYERFRIGHVNTFRKINQIESRSSLFVYFWDPNAL